ncbi:site-2 protease family protein [Sulfitobacter sp. SK012]|uniref:site-2 protease family protein n=1 Tax=Sulfitobacter sp. SK012 TaxID=1389005 RepID=UPI0020C7D36A|nr:site-2 protease family protein [Sulfitobacter sp. SK012]
MFSNSVKIFSLNSIGIKVDPSWLIIASLVTWSLSQGYFPEVLPNASPMAYLSMALVGMFGLFASLLLHEIAHSIVARHLGVTINSITLFIFGGIAELEAEPSSAGDEFWIALAGPVMSFCMAFGFWTFAQAAWLVFSSQVFVAVFSYLGLVNLVLAIFNLVPAFPLDGGRVLRAYLWSRNGDVLAATKIVARSGIFFGYLLMVLGVMALFQGAVFAGIWQLMIGGFILIAARASYASQLARKVFEGNDVSALMERYPITVGPDMTLLEFANRILVVYGVSFVPVVEGSILLGHINQTIL